MTDPDEPTGPSPLLAKGFRLFFLFGGLYAAVVVPLWLLVLKGRLAIDSGVAAVQWHAHEMIYGFAMAIIAGFLLTAVSNWTKRKTASGAPLALIVLVWLAGRVLSLPGFPVAPPVLALVDLAFLPLVFVAIARPLWAAKSKRNYGFPLLVGGLWLLNLLYPLDATEYGAHGWAAPAMRAALDLVLVIVAIVGGRIIPLFTRNGAGATITRRRWADLATIWALVALALHDLFSAPDLWIAPVAAAAGIFALIRSVGWGFRSSLREPLLWVLHIGHAWIPFGLLLRAVSSWGPPLMPMSANHALGLGAVGTLTMAMMARVALGHTGRPLKASRPIALAFAFVVIAGIVRVTLPLVNPGTYLRSLDLAGGLWTVAFVLYLVGFARVLVTSRADGKEG